MKILYAIQGTGNGHIARAGSIIPRLRNYGKVDVLLSGKHVEIAADQTPKYRFHGMGFIFGKNGGIDLWATYRNANFLRFKQEINSLPVHDYDLVISDFEPVSAWACLQRGKPCIGLSHQAAVLHQDAPQPASRLNSGRVILRSYAPTTGQYGFHFQSYGNGIYTPVIRDAVRATKPEDSGHFTVYLPAYSDERITEVLGEFDGPRFEIFSKHTRKIQRINNLIIRPIHDQQFLQSLASARGVLCGAGFETPAEALFLKKKLMVIPMKGQFEQQCNACALEEMGVPVLKSLSTEHIPAIEKWLYDEQHIPVHYPDQTTEIIDQVIRESRSLQTTTTHEKSLFRTAQPSFFHKMAIALISV
jgi:uncharacterized protein (TIGR00661 family)